MHKNYTPIYVNGRAIAKVKGDTLIKSIHGSRHMLRQPRAIAFDVDSLNQAEAAGAVLVNVTDQETGVIYRSTIAHIRDKGIRLNRGYGEQIALPLEGWTTHKRGGGLQLALFGGEA